MPAVYLPAIPMRYDATQDARTPALDTSPAAFFGELITLLTIDRPLAPFEMGAAIAELRMKIAAIEPSDYIVCVGDPIFVAVAAYAALQKNGSVNMLRWDRLSKNYQLVEVVL